MPKLTIDGKQLEFAPGENLIDIAKRGGVDIPYFCYHQGLSVVAQCRMCAVEVEKSPKLQTACSTPAQDGMVIYTKSEKAKQNQASVMEFLLINHPLDCPICDKSGECDLQDNSYNYGDAYMRTSEDRRTYLDLDMGPVIKKNMNRCIHCTRCIRFGDEVAGIREMVAINRGNNTEISTIDGKPLETDYAGNYADICPTGSLTLKDFRFKKRAWMLKKTPSICEGCSRGCNMEVQHDRDVAYRCIPRTNMEVNKHWMCDEGRFNYGYVNAEDRIIYPQMSGKEVALSQAIAALKKSTQGQVLVLVGTDLSNEELELILDFGKRNGSKILIKHFGTEGVATTQDDGDADKILKRKSKTANLHGAEKLGIKAFDGKLDGASTVWVIRGGRAQLPMIPGSVTQIGIGVFNEEEAARFETLIPGLSFLEKDGTFINFQGKSQKFNRAIVPQGGSKALGEILMLTMHSQANSQASTGVA